LREQTRAAVSTVCGGAQNIGTAGAKAPKEGTTYGWAEAPPFPLSRKL
jgi:hypothetical protein